MANVFQALNGDGTIGNTEKDMFIVLNTGYVSWSSLQSLRLVITNLIFLIPVIFLCSITLFKVTYFKVNVSKASYVSLVS